MKLIFGEMMKLSPISSFVFAAVLAGGTLAAATAQADNLQTQGHQNYWVVQDLSPNGNNAAANNGAALNAPPPASSNLSTYPYDPRLDPQKAPYVTPRARDLKASNKVITLGTPTGFEIGAQLSSYRYQEHLVADQELMHISGPSFGVTFDGNKSYANGFFWGGDFRVAYGKHDYTGGDVDLNTGIVTPSKHPGENDWLVETRLLGGHDFIFDNAFGSNANFSLAPYAGLGFRYLYNDGRGTDDLGVKGYSRTSHYFYLPVGITPRFRVTDLSRISLNMEYDQLIYGYQVSFLGDTIPGATEVNNTQHDGYGIRGSLMYEWPKWSMGPFFNYWNINQSESACNNVGCGWIEPHNQTIEYGVQAKYRF